MLADEAFTLIAEYGNVTGDPDLFRKVTPTEAQLEAVADKLQQNKIGNIPLILGAVRDYHASNSVRPSEVRGQGHSSPAPSDGAKATEG